MSTRWKLGALLAMLLFGASFSAAATVERCVTYACTAQEAQVNWAPATVWDGPEQRKAEMLGDFLLGTPVVALIALGILRGFRQRAVLRITK